MPVEMFLKLDGIDGESQTSGHENEIEIQSFSWGASQSGSPALGTGLGTGKVNITDANFQHYYDKASPLLFQNCAKGSHIDSAVLTVRKAGGDSPLEYLKYTFSDVMVTNVSVSGAFGSEQMVESFSLAYASVTMEYQPQGAQGTGEGNVQGGWDLKKNAAAA